MEFEDYIQSLENEEAEKWLSSANNSIMMETIHGRPFPKFNWNIKNK